MDSPPRGDFRAIRLAYARHAGEISVGAHHANEESELFYTVYRQLPDEGDEDAPIPLRRVAFGPELAQNIHVIEADGLRQTAGFFPSVMKFTGFVESHVLEDEGEATLEEIVERFGPIKPLANERDRRMVEEVLWENETAPLEE